MFRGFDPEHDRLVAIKVFQLDLPPERVHRFVAALQRLTSGALKHPAIAAPIAAGIQENTAYLVQEYVAADSLDVVLREQGPAPPGDAVRVAAQLASAIDAGVAHGAIHPRDILLSHLEARMTGFGIVPALEQVGVTAPTRRPYTAPERLAGAAWDRRADIFSLAAVMCEVLTGRRITGTGEQAARAVADLRGVDGAALAAAFARALAESPSDRFDTGGAFAEAMAAAVERKASAERRAPAPAAAPAEARLPLEEPDLLLRDGAAEDVGIRREDLEFVVTLPPLETEVPSQAESLMPDAEAREPRQATVPVPAVTAAKKTPEPPPRSSILRTPLAPTPQPKPSAPAKPAASSKAASPKTPPRGGRVEPEPARTEADAAPPAPSRPAPPRPAAPVEEPLLLSALDRSRSAMWPLALALIVGLALGIPMGFGLYPVLNRAPETPAPSDAGARTAPGAPTASMAPAAPPAGATKAATPARPAAAPAPGAAAKPPAAPPPAAPAAAPARATGRLLVRSTPGGARVFVDGHAHGVTPAELRDLAPGTYSVRVVRDGYQASERRVTITSARPSGTVNVTLTHLPPAPPPAAPAGGAGTLRVESLPSGASVFLDGTLVGTTPMSVANVSAGEHAVRMEMDGYQSWTTTTTVKASEEDRVAGSLER